MPARNQSLVKLGASLRNRRIELGLTQEALAEKANLDPTYISGIERGTRNPSFLSLYKIIKSLGSTFSKITLGIK